MINNYTTLNSSANTGFKNQKRVAGETPPTSRPKASNSWLMSLMLLVMFVFSSGTLWSQIALPYSETFAGISAANGFPTVTGGAWTRSGSTANQPTYIANQSTYNRSGNGDTKFMAFRYDASTRYFFVGPFSLTAGTTYLPSILYKSDGLTGFGPLALTYGTTAAAATQTNTIASVAASITNSAFATLSGSFSPATSGNYFIAIKCTADGNPWYLTVDDFAMSVSTPCTGTPAPGNTVATPSTVAPAGTTVLSLATATAGTGVTYQWQSGSSNTGPWTNVGTSTATYTATIAATTWYQCAVTCSGVTTTSNPGQVIMSYCLPSTGSQTSYTSNFTTTNGVNNIAHTATSGAAGGYLNLSSTVKVSNYIGNLTNLSLTAAGPTCGFAIWVDWNNNLLFETGEKMYGTTGYVTTTTGSITIPLGTANGNYRMRVVVDYNNSAPTSSCATITVGEYKDFTFEVVSPPTCVSPTALVVSSQTLSSATVSWTASTILPANGYEYIYSTTNTAPAVGATPSGTTAAGVTTATFSGLAIDTNYFWWVRANCDGVDKSAWAAGATIRLGYCTPVTTYGCTDGDVIARVVLNTLDNNSGTGCPSDPFPLAAGAPYGPGYSNYTTNPALTTTLQAGSSYNCTVYAGQYSEGYAAWIDYNDNGVFDNVTEKIGFSNGQVTGSGTVGVLGSSASFPIAVSCNPPLGTHRLRVRAMFSTNGSAVTPCTDNGYGEIEDYVVTISAADPCPQPSFLGANTVTTTSANLTWTLGCAETNWEVAVQAAGAGTPSTGVATTSTTYAASGLTPGSQYEFYVRAACTPGSLYSAWSGPFMFSAPACATLVSPANGATNVTMVAGVVQITWATVLGANSYDIYFGTTSGALTNIGTIAGTTVGITGLLFNQTNYWSIIPKNANGSPLACSEWSFTTEGAPAFDTCAGATSLDALTSPISGSTAGLNNDFIPSCNSSNTASDAFYSITVPNGYTLNIGQTTNDYDSVHTAFYGTCASYTELLCMDDPDTLADGPTSQVSWQNTTGSTQTVYWVQDGYSSNAGNFTLAWTLTAPPVTITDFSPTSVCGTAGGTLVTINGINFTGANDVQFNGVSAAFTVVNDTQITATLPAGNTTGYVRVYKAPSLTGYADSASSFVNNTFLDPGTISSATGFTLCIPTILDLDNSAGNGAWSVLAGSSIAAVDGDGFVSGLNEGTATIRFTRTSAGGCVSFVDQNVVVKNPVAISSFTGNQTVVPVEFGGLGTASYSVSATGSGLSYQWYAYDGLSDYVLGIDDTGYGETYAGFNSATLSISGISPDMNGIEYYCIVSGASPCGAQTTQPNATLVVASTGIAQDPAPVTLCGTSSTTFTVVKSGTAPIVYYSWEYQIDSVSAWNPISDGFSPATGLTFADATTASLAVSDIAASNNGYRFRAIITGPTNIATSEAALLTVSAVISSNLATTEVIRCKNTVSPATSLSVTVSGFVNSVVWKYATTAGALDSAYLPVATNSPSTGMSYTASAAGNAYSLAVTTTAATAAASYYFKAFVTGSASCGTLVSNKATITVVNPAVAIASSAAAYCSPGGAAVTLTASGDAGISYVWSNSLGSNASVTVTPLVATTYNVTGTDGNGCTNTASKEISVGASFTVVASASSSSVCEGSVVNLLATPNSAAAGIANISFGTNLESDGTGTASFPITITGIPAGSTITSAQLQLTNVNSINGSYRSEIRAALSGAYSLAATQISTLSSGGLISPDPVINLTGFTATSGTINLLLTDTYDDSGVDATFGEVKLVINYTQAATYTYAWTAAAGLTPSATAQNPSTPALTASTSYSVTATSNFGCSASASTPIINVIPTPVVTATNNGQPSATRCGAGKVNLTATASGSNVLSWYAAPTGGVPLFTGTTFLTPDLTASTPYYVGAATPVPTSPVMTYCASTSTSTSYYITGFSTTGGSKNISNTGTGQSASGYGNYTSLVASQAAGSSIGFSIVGYGTSTYGMAIWIDWNNDGDFDDAGEQVYGSAAYVASATGSITVPTSATFGTYRMRVKADFLTTTPPSCGTSSAYSETEDYIFEVSGCSSPARTLVTAVVTPPPALALSSSVGTICVGQSTGTVNITPETVGNYTTYTWSPADTLTGSSASGYVFTPTASTVYTLTATEAGGCVKSATYTVTVNPNPTVTASASAGTICEGTSTTLTAVTPVTVPANAVIGTGTTLTSQTAQPTAFCNRWGSYRMQTVYTAAQLQAAGLSAGNITSMGFQITSLGSAATNSGMTVKIGTTASSTLSGSFVSTAAFTTVYPSQTYTHTASGWQTIPFSTPYNWDGTSNIIVEVIQNGANSSNNSITYYTATTGNTVAYTTTASSNSASFSANRLNVTFAGQNTTSGAGSLQWSWNPGSLTSNSVVVSPSVTTAYTVRGTNPTTSCYTETVVNVNVNPTPLASIAGTTAVCKNATAPSVTFTGSNGTAPYTFTYTATGLLGNQTVISNNLGVVTIPAPTDTAGTFTYTLVRVQDSSSTTCINPQGGTAVITVNPLPLATIAGTTAVCNNATASTVTFTGSNGTAPYTFTYDAPGAPGQTVTSNGLGVATVAAPTGVVGTFTYTLVSVQDSSATTCSNAQGGSVVITVNPLPLATIAGTIAVCNNATAPTVTFTGTNGTAPYTFTYTVTGLGTLTVKSNDSGVATVTAPTGVVGTFTYTLVSVQDSSTTTCSNAQGGTAVITVNPLPLASIAGTTAVCNNATAPSVTFTGSNGTAPYTFTYDAPGAPGQTVTSDGTGVATVAAPTGVVGAFTYTLVSVQDSSVTTCSNLQGGSVVITVNPLPLASIAGTTTVCQNATAPTVTFTGSNGTAPYTFTYTATGLGSQTVTSDGTGVATVTAPTVAAGTFTYTLVSVQDSSVTTCSNAQGGSAVITVDPTTVGGAVNGGTSPICTGFAPGTLTLSGHTGAILQWESSIDNLNWAPIANTATTYAPGILTITTLFRAVVQSGTCIIAYSTPRTITVYQEYPFYADNDHDGYGAGPVVSLCSINGATAPAGYQVNDTDCDDTKGDRHQSFPFYVDADGDTYGAGTAVQLCAINATTPPVAHYSVNSTDCNDLVASIHPGAFEVAYDSIDQNCNGVITDGGPLVVLNMISHECGQSNFNIEHELQCTKIDLNGRTHGNGLPPGIVVGYRFEITNISVIPNVVAYVISNDRDVRLTDTNIFVFGATFTIRAGAIIGGEFQGFNGNTCQVTTESVGTTKVKGAQCGSRLSLMNSKINVESLSHAKIYRYRVALASAPTVFYYLQKEQPYFNLTEVPGLPLTYETEYKVDVQVFVKLREDVEGWSSYGAVCSIFSPLFPETSVRESQCNYFVTHATSSATVVYANSFPGATMYRFLLIGYDDITGDENYHQVLDRTVPNFTLSMFNALSPLSPNTTYVIAVSMRLYGNYVPYGKDCIITTTATPREGSIKDDVVPFKAAAYPNPFANNFMIDVKSTSTSIVNLKVYDMVGRLIEQRSVSLTELENSPIGENYPSGVYNVVVTQDKEVKTVRVVKR